MALTPTAEAFIERVGHWLEPGWLVGQRWFRAKQRQVVDVVADDAARLDEMDGWLVIASARYADGGRDRYLLPIAARGAEVGEPADGDGIWAALAARIATGDELPAGHGSFAFVPGPAAAELLPEGSRAAADMAERRLGVEQSNTSVVIGDRLILKLYRLLEPGENPDVEVSAFLTDAGFRHTPALAGSAAWLPDDDASCAAAMLQALVPARGDGWRWALEALGEPGGPGRVIDGCRRIGAITAEMHAALASQPEHPGFPARLATPGEVARWYALAAAQLAGALGAVREPADRDRLNRRSGAIAERLARIGAAAGTPASRIHGDYHLGQLLRTADGFAVIDFEGEPARPLVERREPASPLRDLAGMLRSLDYAVRTAARTAQQLGAADDLDADGWLGEARAAFLDGYGAAGRLDAELLAAFELEKACYEIRYEAGNRPGWLWLPLEAVERLTS